MPVSVDLIADQEKQTPDSKIKPLDFEKFSIAESPINESFCNNFKAVLGRRINQYRSKQAICYEFILPIMIMVLGISITSIDFFLRTPSRILQPDRTSSDQ